MYSRRVLDDLWNYICKDLWKYLWSWRQGSAKLNAEVGAQRARSHDQGRRSSKLRRAQCARSHDHGRWISKVRRAQRARSHDQTARTQPAYQILCGARSTGRSVNRTRVAQSKNARQADCEGNAAKTLQLQRASPGTPAWERSAKGSHDEGRRARGQIGLRAQRAQTTRVGGHAGAQEGASRAAPSEGRRGIRGRSGAPGARGGGPCPGVSSRARIGRVLPFAGSNSPPAAEVG